MTGNSNGNPVAWPVDHESAFIATHLRFSHQERYNDLTSFFVVRSLGAAKRFEAWTFTWAAYCASPEFIPGTMEPPRTTGFKLSWLISIVQRCLTLSAMKSCPEA
uniref:Transposase n=1 Tax=Ascaris lumbricoides TaxID=6252 RepID=A0A0M3I1Z2_ASCLU